MSAQDYSRELMETIAEALAQLPESPQGARQTLIAALRREP